MGQRSQIFVKIRAERVAEGFYFLARYYQWNYGERMVSRARFAIEWLKAMARSGIELNKAVRILDTNFDMVDVQISSDLLAEVATYCDDINKETVKDWLFCGDNNDGFLLLDVFQDGTIKYAFLDTAKENVLDADGYMKWDNGPDWFKSKYLTEEDVGIIVLLDERFRQISYRRLFPREWTSYEEVTKDSISERIERFWDEWL